MITRAEATAKILGAKQKQQLSWEQIAKGVGRHKIWSTAALLGQHPMSAEEAESVIKILGFSGEDAQAVSSALQEFPMRGRWTALFRSIRRSIAFTNLSRFTVRLSKRSFMKSLAMGS
jgi:cyanate lyase